MIKPKKSIQDAKGYDSPFEKEEYVLKLDLNENILGPSPKVIEALKNICADDIKFYPVYGELVKKIAESNNVALQMVLPTNGADEAIKYIFDTFIEETDEVLTVRPTFTMPKVYATSTGCKYIEIQYKEKWIFPIDDLLKNISEKTKLIIVTSPNSPTGEIVSEENLLKILYNAPNSLVLLDETYANYANKSYSYLLSEYENLLVTKSMSKDFAIAGLRLGYIISNSQNISFIKRIISPFSVNVLAAKAGVAAIEDKAYFEGVKNEIQTSKQTLIDGLQEIAKKIYPSDANFLCVDFGKKAKFVYKKLLKSGIKVKYYNGDEDLDGCFRMTVPSLKGAELVLNTLKTRDLIVFDIDGVLIDTRNSYRMAIKRTFECFSQKEISFEDIQSAKNLGGLNNDWDLTEYLLKTAGFEISKQNIIDKFQELYFGKTGDGLINQENWLIDKEHLESLAKEYDLAIFTGRPKEEAIFALKKYGVENLFEPIITMDDLDEHSQKPNSKGLFDIIDITEAQKVYYLGDTNDDMISAKSANVNGIGILPPQDKSEKLKKLLQEHGAMVVLESTSQVLEFFGAKKCVQHQ